MTEPRPVVPAVRGPMLVVVAALLGVVSLVVLARPATGQRSDRIDLVAQTTFVTDESVTFDLRLTGPLDDRLLNVRVHEPINDPAALAALWDDPPPAGDATQISNFPIGELDALVVGADIVSVTLPDEEIGLILRREVGALPVVVELIDAADGTILSSLITAVIVDDGTRSSTVDFAFVADARSPFAHRVDGSLDIDPDDAVTRVAGALTDAPGPTLVSLTPETLTALADPRTEGGLAAIDAIRAEVDTHLVPAAPWVDVDEEAWRRAGESDRIFAQYARGQATLEDFLGIVTTPIVRFDPDTTGETLNLLRGVGVTGGVIEPDQVDPLDLERADNRPIDVLDANDVTMPVLIVDRAFEASLSGTDPDLIAQQRFSELVLRARDAGTSRGIVLDLDTVDRAVLTLLLDLAATTDRIGVSDIGELMDRPPARDAAGAVLRVNLVATEPGDVAGAASDLRLTESVLASYTEMVAPADGPIAPLRTLLEAAMADALDTDTRRTFTDSVFNLVIDGSTDFAVLDSSRITLATRSATIPVEIRNDQNLPINVIVRITSDKLRFPDGEERRLALDPGINVLSIPVETVASGDARIQIAVTSPDGRLGLATGAVNVRSTAVSGLGLVVSLLSLAVLLTWWARTIARVRRQHRAASVPDDPSEDGEEAAPAPATPSPEEREPS